MTRSGHDLFVANETGNSLTELNASTGALLRVLSALAYRFAGPDALAFSGPDLFVANFRSSTVTSSTRRRGGW